MLSLDELAVRAAARGAAVPARVVVHLAASCGAECAERRHGGAPSAAALAALPPHSLWARVRVPHPYEAADELRLHGIAWLPRDDSLYTTYASFEPPPPPHGAVDADARLSTERAFCAAWAAAWAAAGGDGDRAWELDAAPCLGGNATGLRFVAATALVLVPRALARAAAETCASALLARGLRRGDDRVVAVGTAPLPLVLDAGAGAGAVRAGAAWAGAARDTELALLDDGGGGGGGRFAAHADALSHHVNALRRPDAASALAGALARHLADGDEALLLLQNWEDLRESVIDLPGGGRRCGESAEDAVARECEEEAAVAAALETASEAAVEVEGGRRVVQVLRVTRVRG